VIAASATLLVVALFAYLRWTFQGRALKAIAQDVDGARLQGVNVPRMKMLGFAIGSALAGVAGGLILPSPWSIRISVHPSCLKCSSSFCSVVSDRSRVPSWVLSCSQASRQSGSPSLANSPFSVLTSW